MLAKRIIPCLDVKNGILTKGIKFKNNIKIGNGDPIAAAKYYSAYGADELVFYDITATPQGHKTMLNMVKKIAQNINIPFCVGGGIKTINDIKNTLLAGADKISINSAAVLNPDLIKKAAKLFGSQCVVLGMDVTNNKIMINGARKKINLQAVQWAKQAEKLGAGEICVNSIDQDGQKNGYDLKLLKLIKQAVNIPIIASGGAGKLEHFLAGAKIADALLAASVFHYRLYDISQVKQYLNKNNICVRI